MNRETKGKVDGQMYGEVDKWCSASFTIHLLIVDIERGEIAEAGNKEVKRRKGPSLALTS